MAPGALCGEKNGILPMNMPDILCGQNLTKISKICADKNHQIWRFWDQSFDMTFTGPDKA